MKNKQINLIKFFIFILGLALLLSATWFFNLPQYFDAESIDGYVSSYGTGGPYIFIGIKALIVGLFLPGTPLTIAGGVLFGPFLGTIYVLIAATVGSAIGFLITRFLAYDFLEPVIQKYFPKLHKYTKRVEKRGVLVTFILRVAQIFPFSVLNIALALTPIRFRDYVVGTFFGLIPGSIIYVVLGDSFLSSKFENIFFAISFLVILWLSGIGLAEHYSKHSNFFK